MFIFQCLAPINSQSRVEYISSDTMAALLALNMCGLGNVSGKHKHNIAIANQSSAKLAQQNKNQQVNMAVAVRSHNACT